MYCEECGQKLEDGSKFCDRCGARVTPLPGNGGGEPPAGAFSSQVFYVEDRRPDISGQAPKEKKGTKVPVVVLSVFAVLLAAAVVVLGFLWLRGRQKPSGGDSVRAETESTDTLDETELSVESQTESAAPESTQAAETKEEEATKKQTEPEKTAEGQTGPETSPAGGTEPGGLKELPHVGAAAPRSLNSGADFAVAARPDGGYSFLYPTDYFHTGSYDEQNQRYLLATADGSVTVEIYETEAPVQGNPYESARKMYETFKGEFLEEAACPYVHQSDGVADDGYSRMIIGGPLADNPSRAAYCCTASDNTTTYIMKISYGAVDHQGIGADHTQTGYLLDCMYRGWSLSGSTYALRSYEQYMDDDMGSKKPGES